MGVVLGCGVHDPQFVKALPIIFYMNPSPLKSFDYPNVPRSLVSTY